MRTVLGWAGVIAAAGLFLAAIGYRAQDPDSVLYARIEARMSAEPLGRWIAPDWPPGWYAQGLYREHPVGIFVLPAALARLGYPGEQAGYAVDLLYKMVAIVLIPSLAATFVARTEAEPLAWLLQLLPVAFTYRIRANQEAALLACLVVALYGLERARSRRPWATLAVAGFVGMLLVKGIVAVLGPAVGVAWLLVVRRRDGQSDTPAWTALALATVAMAATAVAYEMAYRHVTGVSFVGEYLGRQLGAAAAPRSAALLAEKTYNLVWYVARLLWFPFPWAFAVLAAVGLRPAEGDTRARQGLRFTLLVCLLYVGLFSLSDRRADRYIFPAYYAVGACGATAVLHTSARLRGLVARLGPSTPLVVFAVTLGLHVLAGWLHLPTLKLWAPDV